MRENIDETGADSNRYEAVVVMKRLRIVISVLQLAFAALGCGGAASSTGAGE